MNNVIHDALEHLKQVLWAVFLVLLILLALLFLFGRHAGYDVMAWICLGFALIVIAVFGSIFAIDLLRVLIVRAYRHVRRRQTPP